ncbi:SHOCT domain-containing protein [Prevotella sp. kh1p2]|uniref:SHOCT domain-containing protein n=1 Tax=Prevotella sp. kh1p2 TaxID=1761883 RepID=UPI0008D5B295|nr:SHOCT domain-containing protein [Prevotella sp. kh1p2]SES89080.1 Chromosome segregation ATPase [Prevotella sp. kh1p2]SNU11683.1 Chromosome segregation ATPase [Prevotellaceae bacterium KH2P17]
MKPVEIEFLMRDNLTAGLDKSKMSVEQLLGAARRASLIINTKIEEQRKVIDGVNSDLDRMQRKLQTMKPGAGQQELLAEISACKKVLAEETGALQQLEKEHQQAKQGVAQLEQEYRKISISEEQAAAANKSLTDKIREQKAVVKQVEADVRALQKAYEQAAPGNAQGAALAELNAAKKALQEDKNILASLTEEQERNRESNKRLSRQLRELQNDMARMRLNGEQNTEEYRQMAQKAAQLSDTLGDLRAQTNILANDDANLQGFISGVNGLSGAFTTATGVMSLFASENENLMKVQARVQSVMAITMGLQQVFNALNKDSAFRLVTVTKVKNLLTAANYRLATSLGISNAAATALMATLTLGLSVVITGLIVAWNKLSDAQEEAARKAQERVEIESQGRAEMIKTRFEIDTTRESLKNFTGSKEEEKKKCEEMNRKYGEAFGYYDTVAQWYDVLTQKAEQYIQMLFLQAKAQALVNKAVEADEKVNKHKATKPGNADSDMGFFARMGHYMMTAESHGAYDGYAAIERYNKEAYDKRTKELEAERDGFLKQAADLEKQAASIGKSNNIGGHSAPDKPKKTKEKKPKDAKREEERLASELLALQQKNRQEEIDLLKEGSEKKRRQIRENYQKEMEELATQEKKWRDAQKGHLTQEQSDALVKGRTLAAQKQKDGEAEIAKEEAKKRLEQQRDEVQAMSDYLKAYGSFQQQKLAIAKETAQQIAEVDASEVSEATKKWQKAKILKEQQEREASLRFEEISRGIDWNALFSGVGNLTKEMMEPMMEQLRAYVETEDYRKADAETQQKVSDLIQEMRKYVGTDQSATWQKLDEAIKQFTDSVAAYDRAVKAEEAAVKARDEGKKRLASGDITEEEYKALEQKAEELGAATAQARENMEDFGTALNRTSDEVANFTSGLTTALSNAKGWQGVEGFGGLQQSVGQIDQLKGTLDSILPQMGEGMAKTIGTTLSGTMGSALGSIGGGLQSVLSSGMGSVIGIVAQIPKLILDLANGIKSFVTGVLDSITELISLRWIDDLVVSILDAVGNLIDAIFDLPENLFKVLEGIVVNGVGGLLDTVLGRVGNILSFGALSSKGPSDWFTNSNEREVAAAIDRLSKRNELLEQAIEDLTDEMKSARGATAIRISSDAEKLQRETNENYKGIAQAQARYHSSHHSFNYYWGGYSDEQIARLSRQMGRQWTGDLWDLSPEEMKMLRSNVDMWKQIEDTGKGGYGGRVAEKLNAYIEQAGKLEEITATLYENLTTTTKANVFDDFLGSLYDLADGSEEVFDEIAENWQAMVNKMAVNNLVGAKFQKNLEDWYENLAKLNQARTNGELTDAEYRKRLDDLKAEYEGYVNSARNDIDQLRQEGIIKETDKAGGTTQSGKAGAFMAMSQDQGTKLEGLFVSGQMHWASIDDRVEDVVGKMDAAQQHLKKIEDNTGSSAASLSAIKDEIRKIVRDGIKVK